MEDALTQEGRSPQELAQRIETLCRYANNRQGKSDIRKGRDKIGTVPCTQAPKVAKHHRSLSIGCIKAHLWISVASRNDYFGFVCHPFRRFRIWISTRAQICKNFMEPRNRFQAWRNRFHGINSLAPRLQTRALICPCPTRNSICELCELLLRLMFSNEFDDWSPRTKSANFNSKSTALRKKFLNKSIWGGRKRGSNKQGRNGHFGYFFM